MNKKFVSIIALAMCLVFASGCFSSQPVVLVKEVTTIGEIVSEEGYEDNITLGKIADISYNFTGISDGRVLAAIAENAADSDFENADKCAAGDKIKATFKVTMTAGKKEIVLSEGKDLTVCLGGSTLAKEIEDAIIEKKLEAGKEYTFEVKEALDLNLSDSVKRDLKVTITISEIKRLIASEDLETKKEATKNKLETAVKRELAWTAFINLCEVENVKETVVNALIDEKRSSDSVFASKLGTTVLEVTGLTSENYEKSLKAYAKRKYKEDIVTYYLINSEYKNDCKVNDEALLKACEEYKTILGLDNDAELSVSDKDQVKASLQKEIVKQIVLNKTEESK